MKTKANNNAAFLRLILLIGLLGMAPLTLGQAPPNLPASNTKNYGPYPPPASNHVTDIANLLNADDINLLQKRLAQIETQTGVEISVVTIQKLADYPGAANGSIEDFARGLFDAYGVGNMPQNNGVLLVVSRGDRKARIELGDGYGRSRDGAANAIMTNRIIPRFKEGDYRSGIRAGVEGIISEFAWGESRESQTNLPPPRPQTSPRQPTFRFERPEIPMEVYILAVIVAVPILYSLGRNGKRGWGWVIVGMVIVIILAIIRVTIEVVSALLEVAVSGSGSWSSSSGSWGGGSSGFSSGGSSFGGGFSGGGGASGSW